MLLRLGFLDLQTASTQALFQPRCSSDHLYGESIRYRPASNSFSCIEEDILIGGTRCYRAQVTCIYSKSISLNSRPISIFFKVLPIPPVSQTMDVPIAANVLGTMGAVCWSIQVSLPLHLPHFHALSNALIPSYLLSSSSPKSCSITADITRLGSSAP